MVEQGVEVYMTKFIKGSEFSNLNSVIPTGCIHGDDTFIVFGVDDLLLPLDGITKEQMRAYSDNAIQTWTSFAKGK